MKQKLWPKVAFCLKAVVSVTCLRDCFPEGVPAAGVPVYFVLLHAAMFIIVSQSKMKVTLCVWILHLHIPVRSSQCKEGRLFYVVMTTCYWGTRTESLFQNPGFPEPFLISQRLMELQSNVDYQNYLPCLFRSSLAPGFP